MKGLWSDTEVTSPTGLYGVSLVERRHQPAIGRYKEAYSRHLVKVQPNNG